MFILLFDNRILHYFWMG